MKIIWQLEFWKLSLRIRILEIKFKRKWNFENDLRIGVLKIKLWIGVLDIIWRWNFKNKQIKRWARHRVEGHEHKCGVYKMATSLGATRGSNLNLWWSKCGVWLVDQWVPISFWASVCLTVDYTLRALDISGCMLDYCIHLGHRHADYNDWLSWLGILM